MKTIKSILSTIINWISGLLLTPSTMILEIKLLFIKEMISESEFRVIDEVRAHLEDKSNNIFRSLLIDSLIISAIWLVTNNVVGGLLLACLVINYSLIFTVMYEFHDEPINF